MVNKLTVRFSESNAELEQGRPKVNIPAPGIGSRGLQSLLQMKCTAQCQTSWHPAVDK